MKTLKILIAIFLGLNVSAYAQTVSKKADLVIVLIRHGEKPGKGNNLSCAGENRALALPKVLHKKFGVPDHIYVPTVTTGSKTTQSRMFQTISPFAIKYNQNINTAFNEKDSTGVATYLKTKHGIQLLCWEHTVIAPIVRALGVNDPTLKWAGSDFDSIWIVTFKNGKATLSKSKEDIHPSDDCSF
jgi:hypothetical protein